MSEPTEPGRCLKHGYVIARCCVLFEPDRHKPFLAPAAKRVLAKHDPELRAVTDEYFFDALLGSLDDDDTLYDHPVSMSGEPMDPVLFVRWDAIVARLDARTAADCPRCGDEVRGIEAYYAEQGVDFNAPPWRSTSAECQCDGFPTAHEYKMDGCNFGRGEFRHHRRAYPR